MSTDHHTPNLIPSDDGNDKDDQATPLDILLNAITGTSDQYPYTEQDDPTNETVQDEELNLQGFLQAQPPHHADLCHKRSRGAEDGSPRRAKIAKTISSDINLSRPARGAPSKAHSDLCSTVEIWHPKAAQKSYSNEKRMINPPPTLRVFGPLSHLLTGVTLSSRTYPSNIGKTSTCLSSQTHHIPLEVVESEPDAVYSSRKQTREAERQRLRLEAAKAGFGGALPWERSKLVAKERQVLRDGLTFPGLWVSSEIGKAKEFQLELKLARPGEDIGTAKGKTVPNPELPAKVNASAPVTTDSLRISEGHSEPAQSSPFPPDLTEADLEQIANGHTADFVVDPSLGTLDEHLPALETSLSPVVEKFVASSTVEQKPISRPKRSQITPVNIDSPWATFISAPLSIISKPSQKTAKARSMVTCLNESDSFALYVRINAQTVRTKYMKLETDAEGGSPYLVFRTGKWSPFRFEVIKRAVPPYNAEDDTKQPNRYRVFEDEKNAKVLTYGSIITVVDVQTGVRSEPVKLVKVDKNEVVVGADEGGPVSELQRVGFVKYDTNVADQGLQPRWYLSAPGARAGGAELFAPAERYVRAKASSTLQRQVSVSALPSDPVPSTLGEVSSQGEDRLFDHTILDLPQESAIPPQGMSYDNVADGGAAEEPIEAETVLKRKRKTPRRALARATLREDEDVAGSTLVWQEASRGMKEVQIDMGKKLVGPARAILADVERVEDWMCWTIMSVDCFSHTFFNTSSGNEHIPKTPLDPIPRIVSDPKYHPSSNTLDLLISALHTETPYEVYLGSMGPLPVSLWRSASLGDNAKAGMESLATRVDGDSGSLINGRRITTSWPSYMPHTLFVVEMPSREEILAVFAESGADQTVAPATTGPSGQSEDVQSAHNTPDQRDENSGAAPDIDDSPWLAEDERIDINTPSGEMTIQEALRNAENAFNDAIDLTAFEGIEASFEGGDTASDLQAEGQAHAPGQVQGEEQEQDPTLVVLTKVSNEEETVEPEMSLPILLIRKEDGVGFGTGTSVIFPRNVDGVEWVPQVRRQ